MAILLYCVAQPRESVTITSAVCDCAVQSQELTALRVYWSEIVNPETCFGDSESTKKAASQFRDVLREILAVTTPLPFPFPTLLKNADVIARYLSPEQDLYRAALARIGDAVQYEVVASWASEGNEDRATPVSGREYVKRREESTGRVAAVDSKLKSVTAGSVREWRMRQERKTHRWFALVARDCRERFVASLRAAGPSEGVRLRLSGPWAPGEFVRPGDEPG